LIAESWREKAQPVMIMTFGEYASVEYVLVPDLTVRSK
jgi:hypothetical protein